VARLFFALWPEKSLQQRLAKIAHDIQPQCGGKPIPAHNIHLTLVFVGETDQANIPRLIEAANTVRPEIFSLQLDQLGAFRNSKVAWAAPAQTPPQLILLVNDVQNALWQAGFGFDKKPFVPHVTLLRKVVWLELQALDVTLEWHVNGFALVQSISEAGGLRYKVLKHFGGVG
jgi:RNA 2',3'-cyclic 3'-phosphodiesterase